MDVTTFLLFLILRRLEAAWYSELGHGVVQLLEVSRARQLVKHIPGSKYNGPAHIAKLNIMISLASISVGWQCMVDMSEWWDDSQDAKQAFQVSPDPSQF